MMMPRIPLPVSTRWLRISMFAFGVFLMALSYGSFSGGQPFDGLMLFGGGGIVSLVGVVYLADWYEDIDYSLRIIESILVVAVAGGISGCVLYGVRGAVGGAILAGFAAEVFGAFCALYLHVRDEREARDYDREMRKHGREP